MTTATTTAPAATATTKAQLQEQNAALLERIAELEAQLGGQRDQLEQTVWLQSKQPDERNQGYTRDGEPWVSFGAQYARLDKATGQRMYGAYKNFTAYGDVAEAVLEIFSGPTRLVRIGAYERPQPPTQQGARRSDWVVARLEPLHRPDGSTAPQTPTPAPAPQPVVDELEGEELPF